MMGADTETPTNGGTVGYKYDYLLTYAGEVIDLCDSMDEALQARRNLVARIKAGRAPDFLDPDDIEGVGDFPIQKVPAGTYA